MAGLDEVAELAEGAVADGRCVKSDGLIAPGAVEGMLADRRHLDVGKPHVAHVGHQVLGEFLVAEGAGACVRPFPGAEVDLVDGDGPVAPAGCPALVQPVAVAPVRPAEIAHDGRRGRRMLGAETHRIGLLRQQSAGGALDLELVAGTLRNTGQKGLPDAGRPAPAHGVAPPVPVVEVADDGDPSRIGRPDREMHAGDPVARQGMGAQHLPELEVRALAQQMLVHLPQHRTEAEGIVLLPSAALAAKPQAVGARIAPQPGGEEPVPVGGLQSQRLAAPAVGQHGHRLHAGPEDPQHPALPGQAVRTEVGEGIAMLAAGKGGVLARVRERLGHGLVRTPRWRPRCRGHSRGWCGRRRTSPSGRC